jgi:precorrin-6B methylase 2
MGGESAMTWGAQLHLAERLLAGAGSPAPQREAAALLGRVLGVPDALLATRPEEPVQTEQAQIFARWLARRAAGEPLAHITGHLEFMGLDMVIEQASRLPSPGSALFVEIALQWARRHPPGDLIAAEVGTGCGACALALAALEPRFIRIYACDSSPESLAVARANGERYLLNLVVNWLESDGLDGVPESVDLILYGSLDASALAGGRLFAQAAARLNAGGAMMCIAADDMRQVAAESLAQALPTARAWTAPSSEGCVVVVAQLPREPLEALPGAVNTPFE